MTVGVALFVAAFSSLRQVRLLALVIYLAAGLLHLVYHVSHVPETLGRVEGQLTWVALALGAILALVLLWRDLRSSPGR